MINMFLNLYVCFSVHIEGLHHYWARNPATKPSFLKVPAILLRDQLGIFRH